MYVYTLLDYKLTRVTRVIATKFHSLLSPRLLSEASQLRHTCPATFSLNADICWYRTSIQLRLLIIINYIWLCGDVNHDLTTLCGTYSQYKHVWALIKSIHQCQVMNKAFAHHVMTLYHCPPLYTYVSACVIAKTI